VRQAAPDTTTVVPRGELERERLPMPLPAPVIQATWLSAYCRRVTRRSRRSATSGQESGRSDPEEGGDRLRADAASTATSFDHGALARALA
jgi:hypothetical protein